MVLLKYQATALCSLPLSTEVQKAKMPGNTGNGVQQKCSFHLGAWDPSELLVQSCVHTDLKLCFSHAELAKRLYLAWRLEYAAVAV